VARGGNVLVVLGSRAKVVAEFVVSSTEAGGRSGTLEAAHGPVSAFQAAVVLFQSVISVAAGAMTHLLAELGSDRSRVAVVPIRRNPVRRDTGDRLR
jgi:hypothetical protein